jgi:hypothetical protein
MSREVQARLEMIPLPLGVCRWCQLLGDCFQPKHASWLHTIVVGCIRRRLPQLCNGILLERCLDMFKCVESFSAYFSAMRSVQSFWQYRTSMPQALCCRLCLWPMPHRRRSASECLTSMPRDHASRPCLTIFVQPWYASQPR